MVGLNTGVLNAEGLTTERRLNLEGTDAKAESVASVRKLNLEVVEGDMQMTPPYGRE